MHKKFDHKAIEKKWQEKWAADGVYKTTESDKPKAFVLDMFPYPSGEGLHVGHPKGYIATDIYSRFKRMTGHEVLHPMGWDAFGLPAENFAIKNKVHPRAAVEKNVARFKEQLEVLGFDYDWDREINTTDPEYYKWTQWIFIQLYKKGLAYESNEPINWCPGCQTGLANEDLESDGTCERCDSVVEKRPMRQWVLKIREYADRMLEDLDTLSWPEHIKEAQRNWIGKSYGVKYTLSVKDTDFEVQTYSTHFEAFMADTFAVIAPDHPRLEEIVSGTETAHDILLKARDIDKRRTQNRTENDETIEGVFTGRYLIDPITNRELPLWVASYALADYGTGIVKCSCHDERDFAFAKKYDLPLHPVLFPEDETEKQKIQRFEYCYTDMHDGILAEPKEFAGRKSGEIRDEVRGYLEDNTFAESQVAYKIRDWVFSRQRYWGEPIPIIHCEKCGPVAVPEDQLPVTLPEVENYEPSGNGESPLANITDWVNTACPECGGVGKRETNTMPQWAGSSWYYLRFMDNKNSNELVSKEKEKYWAPVDVYVGGDHAVRHLIYARFWHKFLYDIDVVSTIEPFQRLEFLGFILAEDGRKMSKRWGNVINPDDIVKLVGADTLRLYEMFMGPFENTIAWSQDGVVGTRRFIERVNGLPEHFLETEPESTTRQLHKTIKKVSEDIEEFKFNTAVSSMMIFINTAEKDGLSKETFMSFLKLLAPFAPHMTEELWHEVGNESSIHVEQFPVADESLAIDTEVTIGVQINGKLRGNITVASDASEDEAVAAAQANEQLSKRLSGEVLRVVYVPARILNFILKS